METKNGFFIKDLRILKDIKLKDMIIVDNLTHSFGFQLENGVPILEWHNDPKDQELKYLVNYLVEASKVDDVREYNKATLKLLDLVSFNID
jgi:CTD small phosphatase-like protein 2